MKASSIGCVQMVIVKTDGEGRLSNAAAHPSGHAVSQRNLP